MRFKTFPPTARGRGGGGGGGHLYWTVRLQQVGTAPSAKSRLGGEALAGRAGLGFSRDPHRGEGAEVTIGGTGGLSAPSRVVPGRAELPAAASASHAHWPPLRYRAGTSAGRRASYCTCEGHKHWTEKKRQGRVTMPLNWDSGGSAALLG